MSGIAPDGAATAGPTLADLAACFEGAVPAVLATASGRGVPNVTYLSRVHAVDADGGDLVVGGSFPTISGVAVNHIARGGPGNWQPLGTGVESTGAVFAVARTGNGDVVAGGTFATAGGIAAANIARWNGNAWTPLGAGLNGTVQAIRVLANARSSFCIR